MLPQKVMYPSPSYLSTDKKSARRRPQKHKNVDTTRQLRGSDAFAIFLVFYFKEEINSFRGSSSL